MRLCDKRKERDKIVYEKRQFTRSRNLNNLFKFSWNGIKIFTWAECRWYCWEAQSVSVFPLLHKWNAFGIRDCQYPKSRRFSPTTWSATTTTTSWTTVSTTTSPPPLPPTSTISLGLATAERRSTACWREVLERNRIFFVKFVFHSSQGGLRNSSCQFIRWFDPKGRGRKWKFATPTPTFTLWDPFHHVPSPPSSSLFSKMTQCSDAFRSLLFFSRVDLNFLRQFKMPRMYA